MAETLKKTFVKDLYSRIEAALTASGFRRRETGIHTYAFSEDMSGWLGLQANWRPPDLEIFPVVGARSDAVERQVALLAGRPPHDYIPACVSIHLGYLMPKHTYTVWSFPLGKEISSKVADMVTAVQRFGIPFMEKNHTLAALCETMASGKIGITHQIAYSLPVAYALLGKLDEAEAYLDVELKKLGRAEHDAAKLYRKFAEAFRNRYPR